jgi:hypothetical protein
MHKSATKCNVTIGKWYKNKHGASKIIDTFETYQWGESSAIFADCVDLAVLVGNVSFKHYPREANEAAHELARVCFSSISSCNWVDEPPSFLLEKLINDIIEL